MTEIVATGPAALARFLDEWVRAPQDCWFCYEIATYCPTGELHCLMRIGEDEGEKLALTLGQLRSFVEALHGAPPLFSLDLLADSVRAALADMEAYNKPLN